MNVRKLFYLLVSVLCLQSVSATDFTVPRLSPLPVKVEKQKIPLGGNWQFNPSPEKEFWKQGNVTNWKSIEVPGEWVMQGFEVGGDDYLVKPFSNMELISRVKALLRRRNVYDREIIEDNAGNEYIDRKDIRIYENKNRVEVNGIGVKFTRKEYEIIKLLAKHPDRIYTLEVIYSNIWEELYTYNSGNTVMVHIKNIRNKFYEICNRAVIETIWGKGYKFEK